jgi:hypothetical protein
MLICFVLGKTILLAFIEQHQYDIGPEKRNWKIIKTKVMNERKKMTTKTDAAWKNLH